MTKPLNERLHDAKVEFAKADAALLRQPGKVPLEVGDHFRAIIALGGDVEQLLDLIQIRSAARRLLDGLENDPDADDLVPLGTQKAKFRHVRMIGVQA
jgi:hypothetical protein